MQIWCKCLQWLVCIACRLKIKTTNLDNTFFVIRLKLCPANLHCLAKNAKLQNLYARNVYCKGVLTEFMCCVQGMCVCFGFSSPTETTKTYLFTHCEHNLAINASPASFCCHCDNVGAPAALPGQAPEFTIDFTNSEWSLDFHLFVLRKIDDIFPPHTWLVATGSLYSGPEVLH